MPNEEAMIVLPTIHVQSSHDAFCNLTSVDLEAGRILPIEIGYNMSVSMLISYNGSSRVYNMVTLERAEEYEPEDLTMSLAEAQAFYWEIAQVGAGLGALGGFCAFVVRSKT